ncbi:hypothetical protein M3T53_00580 [Actinomyces sp. B33]|uniref:hypothetical protein n=1 Tax=Actinomyces sp. B33 TaxID=2942131 RepID=UPI002340898F|nr:hypothetical protein [Actinomyces sp. B33]MDC4232213.1 hypothetical protein [Actinomyces sp. B33]
MLSYRTVFEINVDRSVGISRQDAIDVILGEAFNWIRDKKRVKEIDTLEPWVEKELSNGGRVIYGKGATPADDQYGKFVYFDPPQKVGQWVTTLLIGARPKNPHAVIVSIEIDAPEDPGRPRAPHFASCPVLVKNILDGFDCYDMGVKISDHPIRVDDEEQLEGFLNALEDPGRRGLIIACGTDGTVPESEWLGIFDEITSQCSGQAAVFLLDKAMMGRYNEHPRVSEGHRLRPYSIRTFKPGARIDAAEDGLRHRFLAPRTLLSRRKSELIDFYGRLCRAHARELPQDRYIRRLDAFASAELDRVALQASRIERFSRGDSTMKASATGARDAVSALAHLADAGPENSAVPVERRSAQASATAQRAVAKPDAIRAGMTAKPSAAPLPVTQKQNPAPVVSSKADRGRVEKIERENEELRAQNSSNAETIAVLRDRVERLSRRIDEHEGRFEEELNRCLDEQRAEDISQYEDRIDTYKERERELCEKYELALLEVQDRNSELEERDKQVRKLQYHLKRAQELIRSHNLSDQETRDIPKDPYEEWEIYTWEELEIFFDEMFKNLVPPQDWKPTFELDAQQESATWLQTTLKILKTLDQYVAFKSTEEGRAFGGDLRKYLSHGASSAGRYTFSAERYRSSESQTTMNQWGSERDFKVPEEVDASGLLRMVKHVEIQTRGSISPRLYFEDRIKEQSRIVIGYIGRHLTNTKTC